MRAPVRQLYWHGALMMGGPGPRQIAQMQKASQPKSNAGKSPNVVKGNPAELAKKRRDYRKDYESRNSGGNRSLMMVVAAIIILGIVAVIYESLLS